jgi:hypothetical protein
MLDELERIWKESVVEGLRKTIRTSVGVASVVVEI